jgi:malonate-semialdehyde dehydrogenase (acetylating)/methylmalonate-semialdehyde dehydrogenase
VTVSVQSYGRLRAYIGGRWVEPEAEAWAEVYDPGTGRVIGEVPFCAPGDVAAAVEAAQEAFERWSQEPVHRRVELLLRMHRVLKEHLDELARVNSLNHGKTLEESRGDLRRTLENVEAAIAATLELAKGARLDNVGAGVDAYSVKEPLGVFAVVAPFNFPIMVPFWFLPYALGLGCTLVVKPSEITPIPLVETVKLLEKEAQIPPGLINIVHGSKEVVERLVRDPRVAGICFVGSTPVAKRVYALAGENGKRCIAGGGAKNFCVVLPDADLSSAVPGLIQSFFGNAGQRCLSGSNLLVVGDIERPLLEKFRAAASSLKVGHGLEPDTQMGPLVTARARERVKQHVARALEQGARLEHGGEEAKVPGYEGGFYYGPTILSGISPDMEIARTEVFGPVAGVIRAESVDEAVELVNRSTSYGNAVSVFTRSGEAARRFRRGVKAGNVGINVPVPAPVAYFPFAGMRDSFFGVLHPQIEVVDFFTDRKVVLERW